MARVSHKKVRQLLNQERNKITDRQFFVSRILAGHFQDMAAAQTRRYGYDRRVSVSIVWEPKTPCPARTDNSLIWINAGHDMVTTHKTRRERYDIIAGLFAHELGHVLYTDFLCAQTYGAKACAGVWYPERPVCTEACLRFNISDIEEYRSESATHARLLAALAHRMLANSLEDGYIEECILRDYPGVLGNCLGFLRDAVWTAFPNVTQMIEQETEERCKFNSIHQIMLSYARNGEIKYGETPLSDERIQMVFSCLPDIDAALQTTDARERWQCVNMLIVRCWKYLKPFLDYCEEHGIGEGTPLGHGETAIGTGLTSPVSGGPAASGPSATAKQRAATAKAAERTESDDEAGESGSAPEEAAPARPEEEAASVSTNDSGILPPQGEEMPRIPLQQTATIASPIRGDLERDDDYSGLNYDASGKDIEALLTRIAEERLETKRGVELNDLAQNISYGNAHEGVKITVKRITQLGDSYREQYDQAAPPLLAISKQLQRNITRQLQDHRRGGKQTGLYMGRRLDVHALPRTDGRVFTKSSLPNEIPELAVALLLDESGSMHGSRATYARASAIILYDFCASLGIPVMVYGHSTGGGVNLFSYAEFEAIDGQDRYRMMDISARGSNRDGAALRFVADQLAKRQEDIKLLILVSDGQPADDGYYGTAAEEDLRGIKQEYKRKGIHLIAAAIGDDKENIERIYGDSFLDITDLSKLPVTLTNAVKRFIHA